MTTPLLPLVALMLTSVAIVLLRRPAIAWGLADIPGGRKQHEGTIPLTGGLGVFLGFLLVQPLLAVPLADLLPLYAGVVMLVACGVIDDARDMRSGVKLGVQLLAATLMVVWGGHSLETLGEFPGVGAVHLGWLAVPVTIVAVAGLINAINMMDGVDGLAGGSALGSLAWLALVAALQGQTGLFAVIVTLGASLVGFLLFNIRHPWRRRASVFMGDAGSMALGFAIAWCVVALSQSDRAVVSPIAYGWVVALPVMDTLSLMVRRLRKGRSPFSADRDHLHHIFLRAGFTPGQTTMILMLLVVAFGGVGVMLSLARVPDAVLLVGLLLVAGLHAMFVGRAWRTSKALKRLHRLTLGHELAASGAGLMRLRRHAQVGRGRRQVALLGLYTLAFTLGLDARLAVLGGGLVLAAAALAYPLFWRDVLRLRLFWLSLALTAYVLLHAQLGGDAGASWAATPWWGLLAVTGLVSLPMAWWLAQLRLHWNWLVLTLVVGGVLTFLVEADWPRLNALQLASPGAWGAPAGMGFMASLGLVMLLALLFVGLQRLGTGWRPALQVGVALALSVPGVIVLMGTGYFTAWVATAMGGLVYVLASPVLGQHPGHRLGRIGIIALLGVAVVGVLSHDWLIHPQASFAQRLLVPLQAIGLALNGELAEARALHAGVVERLLLWQQAWQAVATQPLFGTGQLAPAIGSGELSGYRDYASLVAGIASALGLVGLVGFVAVAAIPLRSMVWANLRRHWHPVWGLGILSCTVCVMVFSLFAMPLHHPGAVGVMVLLSAAMQVACFQRAWYRGRTQK